MIAWSTNRVQRNRVAMTPCPAAYGSEYEFDQLRAARAQRDERHGLRMAHHLRFEAIDAAGESGADAQTSYDVSKNYDDEKKPTDSLQKGATPPYAEKAYVDLP